MVEKKKGRLKRAATKGREVFTSARSYGLVAIVGGLALILLAIALGPGDDFTLIGVADDPIALALGMGGGVLLIFGLSRLSGKDR